MAMSEKSDGLQRPAQSMFRADRAYLL
jgi:hypothetical protein